MAKTLNMIMQELQETFNETELEIFKGMLQGDSLKQTAENFAISVAEAQAHRRFIYEVLENYVDFGGCKQTKQTKLMQWFHGLSGNELKCKIDKSIPIEASATELNETAKTENEITEKIIGKVENNQFIKNDTPHSDGFIMTFKNKDCDKQEIQICSDCKVQAVCPFFIIKQQNAEIEQMKLQEFCGSFYVFNPKHGQPRKVYGSYVAALNDAKQLSLQHLSNVFVLKILTKCCTQTLLDVVDMRQEEEIPF